MIRKSKLEMYRELIRKPAQQGEEIKLPINGGSAKIVETQEDKDKKKNTTIIKITEKEKQEENKPKPTKNNISDAKLKKFINFRL